MERKKIKAEDLADLKNKTDEELREIIEKQRFTTRDLNDQLGEHKTSSEQREKELEEQIVGLNNMIQNLKTDRRGSVVNVHALAALSGKSPRGPSPRAGGKFGGAALALATKLPFGKKAKPKENKADKIAARLCQFVFHTILLLRYTVKSEKRLCFFFFFFDLE